jgi:predicted nucleic acid-binding protein
VVDASVAIAIVLHEHLGDRLHRLLIRRAHAGDPIIVPNTLWVEVVNVLARRYRHAAEEIFESIATLDGLGFSTIDTGRPGLLSTIDIAVSYGLTAWDAVYLALAESSDADLLTLDRQLAAAAGPRALNGRGWFDRRGAGALPARAMDDLGGAAGVPRCRSDRGGQPRLGTSRGEQSHALADAHQLTQAILDARAFGRRCPVAQGVIDLVFLARGGRAQLLELGRVLVAGRIGQSTMRLEDVKVVRGRQAIEVALRALVPRFGWSAVAIMPPGLGVDALHRFLPIQSAPAKSLAGSCSDGIGPGPMRTECREGYATPVHCGVRARTKRAVLDSRRQ